MDQTILEVQDLRIHFELREGTVKALNGIDLVLKEGRSLGLVGETGAGKTTLAKGIMGLTAKPYGKIKSGQKASSSNPRRAHLYDFSGSHDKPEPGDDRRRSNCRGNTQS